MASSDIVQYRSPLRTAVNVAIAVFLGVYVVSTHLPLVVMFVSSFKDLLEAFNLPRVGDWGGITLFFDFTPTFKHYTDLFADGAFGTYIFNSIAASAGSAVISVVLGSMCAYSLSRHNFRGKQELSGGQKQRVAIGRAIVREPQLFLFDEPIAHLDAKLRAHMRGELKIMQRELGTTMIYVTHDQLEALSMADRIAVMHEGVLQQFGTPREIYNHPVNEWVAGFVGEPPMNFVDCRIEEHNDQIVVVHPAFTVPVSEAQSALLREKASAPEVEMGIRPDQISIATDAQTAGIPGDILVTEPLGGDMLVDMAIGADKFMVKTHPDFAGRRGDACHISFDTSRWHLFARDTGLAYF